MAFLKATRDKAIALLRRLRDDSSGNVLMFFGFAMIPAIGLTGAAIDYARATTVRAQLSAAVDSAALMAARDATKLNDADLRIRINGWIKATLSPEEAAKFTGATIVIDRTARTVTIDAKVPVEKTVFRVVNADDMLVASKSQSSWGTNTIEIALALDNTGSMSSSNKMTALKTAAKNLVNIMKETSTEPNQIRIAIVPFATQVRLDPVTYKDVPWLRFDLTRTTNCSYDRYGRYVCDTEKIDKVKWRGCVSDRDKTNDASDAAPVTGVSATLYPADFCRYGELAPVLPLTENWSALTNRIDSMVATGNTNVTIGAIWGLAALTPMTPLTEAAHSNTPRLQKFMILLTDGDNTENRAGDSASNIDKRTAAACTSAKDAGVRVYTIRVINGNATLLKSCATDATMYYDVKNAAQLNPVFEQIAREISQVRLTQ